MKESKYFLVGIIDRATDNELLGQAAKELGFEFLNFDNPQDLLAHLSQFSNRTALLFLRHCPPEVDGFQIKEEINKKYHSLPTILKIEDIVPLDEMDKVIRLKIESVIASFERDDLIACIEKYNRKETLEIEEQILEVFVTESAELLELVEAAILDLEADFCNMDALNRIFRAVHTIKGNCHLLHWPEFESYTHEFERLLSDLSSFKVSMSRQIGGILLKSCDRMVELVKAIQDDSRIEFNLDDWMKDLDPSNLSESDEGLASKGDEQGMAVRKVSPERASEVVRTVKVPIDSLSQLSYYISLISEHQQVLIDHLGSLSSENLEEKRDHIDFLANELKDIEKKLVEKLEEVRCVSIKTVYRTLPRLVRDLSEDLSKKVQLELHGEDIRIDNTIASVLNNTLVHLIRNSLDHGIELPQARMEKGKPERGTLAVRAHKDGKNFIIEIEDDGGGVNLEKVKSHAKSKNLFTDQELDKMDEGEIANLIFMPGFSTAESVTKISGRGAGMDMVKSSVESAGGRLNLTSQEGLGSKFLLEFSTDQNVMYF